MVHFRSHNIFFAPECLFANFGALYAGPSLLLSEIILVDPKNPGFNTFGFEGLKFQCKC